MSVALVTSESDHITWTSGGGIPQIDSFTFIGWFKPSFGSLTTPNFFSIGETGVAGRSIYHDESQFIIWRGSAGTGQGTVSDATWYCIAWRGNGTELKGYRKLANATSFTTWTEDQGSGTLTENNVSIGRWINGTSHWNGEIRAVKGWNTALTDAELEYESRQFSPVKTSGILWYVGLSDSTDTSDASGNGYNPTTSGLANGSTNPTLPPPAITTQPSTATVYTGQTAQFTVAAAGDGTLTYQWQRSTNGGASYSNVSGGSGATTTTYTTPTLGFDEHNYLYRCQVTNSNGTTDSDGARLILTPAVSISWIGA